MVINRSPGGAVHGGYPTILARRRRLVECLQHQQKWEVPVWEGNMHAQGYEGNKKACRQQLGVETLQRTSKRADERCN